MTDIIQIAQGKPFDDGPWEIVCAGPHAWIGKVAAVETDFDDEVTLHPCFAYIFQVSGSPQGPQMIRDVWPLELFVSNVPVRVRWTHRRRLADFDEADREMLHKLVQSAVEAQKGLRAARANLVLGGPIPPHAAGPRARG